MSLLSEKVRTVLQYQSVSNSSVQLGLPSVVAGGVSYNTVVGKCEPRNANTIYVLHDVVTNEPLRLMGNALPYAVIFEGNPALETTDPLFFELVATSSVPSSNYAGIASGGSNNDINNKYYLPLVEDGLSAGAYNQLEFPVLAIRPANFSVPGGPGTITAGTLYVTLISSFF